MQSIFYFEIYNSEELEVETAIYIYIFFNYLVQKTELLKTSR